MTVFVWRAFSFFVDFLIYCVFSLAGRNHRDPQQMFGVLWEILLNSNVSCNLLCIIVYLYDSRMRKDSAERCLHEMSYLLSLRNILLPRLNTFTATDFLKFSYLGR